MSFQSIIFLVFLAVAAMLCNWTGQKDDQRGMKDLLFVSFLFYIWPLTIEAFWGMLLMLAGTVVSWNVALYLNAKKKGRKAVFIFAVAWHIVILVQMKYMGFLTGGALEQAWVPMGISFFTFQQIWFLKEVYTGEFQIVGGNREFTLYSLFFPTITSGPILRPGVIFPQLRHRRLFHPAGKDVAAGIFGISYGLAKKVLLADNLGVIVNAAWADTTALSAPAAWLAILCYSLQLYLDFSGYCDIAAGAARLFGIYLPNNFHAPYRALSVGEFWKRWHITLTTFLRECVYIPLGGSRKGMKRMYLNILLVYLISGFWHGAGWTFIIWGLLHGLAQVAERALQGKELRFPAWARWLLTFSFITFAWVFFRAPDLGSAGGMLSAAFGGGSGTVAASSLLSGMLDAEITALTGLLPVLTTAAPWLGLGVLLAASAVISAIQGPDWSQEFRPSWWLAPVCVVLLVWSILSFQAQGSFIYANF